MSAVPMRPAHAGTFASPPVRAEPVATAERIQLLDMLRGFALLGILAVNMSIFSAPFLWQVIGQARGSGPLDSAAEFAVIWLAQSKFYPLFSFLFGLGAALQMARLRARGQSAGRFFLRRFGVLMLFGLAHALLFWNGDILFIYALVGLVSLFWRNSQTRTLLIWAAILLALPVLGSAALSALSVALTPAAGASPAADAQMAEAMRFVTDLTARATATYATGTWGEIFVWRAIEWLVILVVFIFSNGLQILGLLLLGQYAGKRAWFGDIGAHRGVFTRMALIGLGAGLPLNLLYALLMRQGGTMTGGPAMLAAPLILVAGPLLACGYIGALALLSQNPRGARALAPLAAAGRMNLSNYLLQTIVCTTIFYSYGLGLFGKVGAAAGLALTLAIWLAQLVLSQVLMRRVRFGPMEWLWRTLSDGHRP
jgi:uncharacterized protein